MKHKVIIGIPTMNSEMYIEKTLLELKKEILLLKKYIVMLVICINGDNYIKINILKDIIKNITKIYPCEVKVLISNKLGKNNALNKILKIAKKNKYDLIHFIDDDIRFKEGSIEENITLLIKKSEQYQTKYILTGSHFEGKKMSFKNQLKNFYLKGIWYYFFQKIIGLPFERIEENPKFCLGGAICGFLEIYPFYPNSDTGIADDGFIGNYFLINSNLTEKNICPLFKSKNSIMYFNLANNYKEWKLQQVRIFIGVFYSYEYFKENYLLFKKYFSWEYSIGKDFRVSFKNKKNINFKIKILLLKLFYSSVLKESKKIIEKRNCPEWNVAISSKFM